MPSCKTYPVESSHATMAAEITELRARKAELLAACKMGLEMAEGTIRQTWAEARTILRAAIARAEAGRG